jgi:DNA-binding transcriptional regulator PaaX
MASSNASIKADVEGKSGDIRDRPGALLQSLEMTPNLISKNTQNTLKKNALRAI